MAADNERLGAALALVRLGQAVLPLWWTDQAGVCQCPKSGDCSSPGKHPLTFHGKDDATTNERQIRQWWRKWPLANPGARTDLVHRIDLDNSKVASALQSEDSLALMTEVVGTPRPGLHISFIPPRPMPTQVLYLADGSWLGELRGLDAYVVVPPSRIGDREYVRVSPGEVGPARLSDPLSWLDGLLREHGYGLGQGPTKREYTKLADPVYEGEGRHNALVSLAGRIYVDGFSTETLADMLDAVNQRRCRPPLPREEVEEIARHFIEKRQPLPDRDGILSAAYRVEVPAERNREPLNFRTAAEFSQSSPGSVPWVVKPWVVLGGLTELDGKVKASGKTTFMTHMVASVLEGRPFLGEPTKQSPVVYLTEQADASFREALRRARLLEQKDLHILSWKDAADRPWSETVKGAVQKCLDVGARLLVVDTLPQFAGIEGDGENSSGAALEAMRPLQLAASKNDIGVIFSRHERKSGGEVGDSGRGSTAFSGGADIVMVLRPSTIPSRPNMRVIHALGRFDETPRSLVVELTENGYEVRGDERALGMVRARQFLEENLPRKQEQAVTPDELAGGAGVGKTLMKEALDVMKEEGLVERTGQGVRGSPYRYWRL